MEEGLTGRAHAAVSVREGRWTGPKEGTGPAGERRKGETAGPAAWVWAERRKKKEMGWARKRNKRENDFAFSFEIDPNKFNSNLNSGNSISNQTTSNKTMYCSMNATQTKRPHLIFKAINYFFTKFPVKKINIGKILKL